MTEYQSKLSEEKDYFIWSKSIQSPITSNGEFLSLKGVNFAQLELIKSPLNSIKKGKFYRLITTLNGSVILNDHLVFENCQIGLTTEPWKSGYDLLRTKVRETIIFEEQGTIKTLLDLYDELGIEGKKTFLAHIFNDVIRIIK